MKRLTILTVVTIGILVNFAVAGIAQVQCRAFLGFTAATGANSEHNDILNWSVAGTPINYPDFSSTNGLNLVGNAAQSGTTVRLTPDALSQVGAMWSTTPVPILNGFDTTFQFNILGGTAGLADGIAFHVQNSPSGDTAIGTAGGGIGMQGISHDLAVEFDTFFNASLNDPSVPHISVMTRGLLPNSADHDIASLGNATVVSLTGTHTARIVYVPGTLKVFFDGSATPTLEVGVNLAVIGGPGCEGVAPAMSAFGLGALALLLLVGAVWVLRRRRRASPLVLLEL